MRESLETVHLSGKRRLPARADAVWAALFDPDGLCRCIPGCQHMRQIDDERYVAHLNVPIPLLSGLYEAQIAATDQRRPERCRLTLSSDTRFGAVRAAGWLSLVEDGDGTELAFDGDLQLGRWTSGSGAGLGGRLLAAPARVLLGRFFDCLAASVAPGRARA